jgi:hypothetical protein
MIFRRPIFPNNDDEIEVIFGYTEQDIYTNKYNVPRNAFVYDAYDCSVYFSKDLKDWLNDNIGKENFKLTYAFGYRIVFKYKHDALKFKLYWI